MYVHERMHNVYTSTHTHATLLAHPTDMNAFSYIHRYRSTLIEVRQFTTYKIRKIYVSKSSRSSSKKEKKKGLPL